MADSSYQDGLTAESSIGTDLKSKMDAEINNIFNSDRQKHPPFTVQIQHRDIETATFKQQNGFHELRHKCNRTIQKQCNKLNFECFKSAALRLYRRQRQIIIPFIWGILVGITLTAVLFQQHILYSGAVPWPAEGAKRTENVDILAPTITDRHSELTTSLRAMQKDLEIVKPILPEPEFHRAEDETRIKTRLFVGVITAEMFLNTRAQAVNSTWGGQVDKLEFFTEKGDKSKHGIPVVNLKGVSDHEYPPQKKMFRMLQHVCGHHVEDYEWFVRADDDVYIRVDELKRFLSKIDGEKMIYMGQPGHGVPEVREKLGLNGHNFCMGGPGVIFNRKALKKLCPHIESCLSEVVSGEEDVELGRCVTNHLHIECTHAWETLKLFYHSYQEEYTEEKPFLGNLAENTHVGRALTLHHIKVPYIMYRVHRHYTSLALNSTNQALYSLRQNIAATNTMYPVTQQRHLADGEFDVSPFKPRRVSETTNWKSFSVESTYSLSPSDVTDDITNDVLADLKQIGETGIDEAIGQDQDKFSYSHLSDGFVRSDPVRGTDYLLDVYFSSKQAGVADQIRRVHLLRPSGKLEVTGIRESSSIVTGSKNPLYVIVPISQSQATEFESFMRNQFEPAFLSRDANHVVSLIVVATGGAGRKEQGWSVAPTAGEVINWYKVKYPEADIELLEEGAAGIQEAFAAGLRRVDEVVRRRARRVDPDDVIALLTSLNVSLTAGVHGSCLFRTGRPLADGDFNNNHYNFVEYRGRASGDSPPQLYQPLPFRVFPAASLGPWPTAQVRQSVTLRPGAGGVPHSLVTRDVGFWDAGSATGETGNAVIAPLCGRLSDLFAVASRAPTNGSNFRDELFDLIYGGQLTILRAPDRSFVNKPTR